jgi:hypothetical protein
VEVNVTEDETREATVAKMRAKAEEQAPTVLSTLTPEEIALILAFYTPGASRRWSDYEGMPTLSLIEKKLIRADWAPWGTALGRAVHRLLSG